MQVYYSDHFNIPLEETHRFPMTKYRLLREYLISEKILSEQQLHPSPLASEELLATVHDASYIAGMRDGTLDVSTMRKIGFPWSVELYNRSRSSVAGTLEAAKMALKEGIAGNLAGGTHHAHADRGEGFCVFNDIAIASRYLLDHGFVKRVAVIDLDVHQGDGNSSILGPDGNVFVFSIHGEKNYPFKKETSDLDIALPDGADDEMYLASLDRGLNAVEKFKPDFIFYLMGVDSLKEDALGRMNLTFEGLIHRDERVLGFAKARSVPVCLALGGGYAKPIELTVQAYANTYRVAKRIYCKPYSTTNVVA